MNLESLLMGVLPSIGALAIFFLAVRGVIRADRNERAAIAREEAEAVAAAGDSDGSRLARAESEGSAPTP